MTFPRENPKSCSVDQGAISWSAATGRRVVPPLLLLGPVIAAGGIALYLPDQVPLSTARQVSLPSDTDLPAVEPRAQHPPSPNGSPSRCPSIRGTLRVALTPVVLEGAYDTNQVFVSYLAERLCRRPQLIQRRSYDEIQDLLGRGEVDVAWICGRPYVEDRDRLGLNLIAAPQYYEDGPTYYSYVIVRRDSPVTNLQALRGRIYAFSDPRSNSGSLVPTYELARLGESPQTFFSRVLYTFSHTESVVAVAQRVVDGASVDSYVYDLLAARRPELIASTRIIGRSSPHGMTPIVAARTLEPKDREILHDALLGMGSDDAGKQLLREFGLRGFVDVSDSLYASIATMAQAVTEAQGRMAEKEP